MPKRPRYTDEQRAEAVVLLRASGYPDRKGALQALSDKLGIPGTTIRRWYEAVSNPPPDEIVAEKKRDIADMLEDEVYAVLGVLPEKRLDADYRALVTAIGIMVDKMRLLRGLPTEIIEIAPQLEQLIELLKANGTSPQLFVGRAIERLRSNLN